MTVKEELTLVDQAQRHVNRLHLVTTVGVMPSYMGSLTKYDASMLALYSSTLDDASQWTISDLLVWVEQRAGAERDAQWADLLRMCGREYTMGTLLNMRATAKAFPWERRRHSEVLKFRHHRLLVPYSTEEQEQWLDQAEAGEWSSAKLEQELYWCRQPGHGPAIRRMDEAADLFRSVGLRFERVDEYHATLHHEKHMVHIGVGESGLMFTLERGA